MDSESDFEPDLERLLDGLPADIAALARALVTSLRHIRPDFVPKVRFGWRSVNFRHREAGFVCGVFAYPDRVSLIFEQGRLLSNEHGLLQGQGAQIRFIRLVPGDAVPEPEIALLIAEAVALKG